MTKIRTSAPTVLAVTLADAKLALRIDGSDMDGLVTIWLQGIIADLEHDIGQYLMPQGWRVVLPSFPVLQRNLADPRVSGAFAYAPLQQRSGPIDLPHPATAVTSVTYMDPAGARQILDPSAYRLVVDKYRSRLLPALGAIWPDAYGVDVGDADSIHVDVTCGIGTTDADTPPAIKLYVLAKLAEQYDPATRMERDTVQSTFVDRLLDGCRVPV